MPTPIDPFALQPERQQEEKRKAGKPVRLKERTASKRPAEVSNFSEILQGDVLKHILQAQTISNEQVSHKVFLKKIDAAAQAALLNKKKTQAKPLKAYIEEESDWENLSEDYDEQSVILPSVASSWKEGSRDSLRDLFFKRQETNEATQEMQAEDARSIVTEVTDPQSEKIFQEAAVAAGLMGEEEADIHSNMPGGFDKQAFVEEEAPLRTAEEKGKAVEIIHIKNAEELDALLQSEPQKRRQTIPLSDLAKYNELLEQQEEQELLPEEIISEESTAYKEQINKRRAQIKKELEDLLSEMQFWARTQYPEMKLQYKNLKVSKTALKSEKERVEIRYKILREIRDEYEYLSDANIQKFISIAKQLFSSELFYKNNQLWIEKAIESLNNLEDSSSFIKTTDKKFLDLLEELYNTYYFIDDKGIKRQLEYPTPTCKKAKAAISRRRKKIKENIQITSEVEVLKEEHVPQFDAQNNLIEEDAGEGSYQESITFEGIQPQSSQEQQVFEAQEEVYDKTLPNDADEGSHQKSITLESTSQPPQDQQVFEAQAEVYDKPLQQMDTGLTKAEKTVGALRYAMGLENLANTLSQEENPFEEEDMNESLPENAKQHSDNIVGRSTENILKDPKEMRRLIKGKDKQGSSDYNYGFSGEEEDSSSERTKRRRSRHHRKHSVSREGGRNSQGDLLSISDKPSKSSRRSGLVKTSEGREISKTSGFTKTLKKGMNKFFSTQSGRNAELSSSSEKLDRKENKQSASAVEISQAPSRRRRRRTKYAHRHTQPNHAGNRSISETREQTSTRSQRESQSDTKSQYKKHRRQSSSGSNPEGQRPSRKFPKVSREVSERDKYASVAAPTQDDHQSVIFHRSTDTLETVESIASSEIISGSDASTIIESARKNNKNTIKNERGAYQRDLIDSPSIKKLEKHSHKVRQEALSRQVGKLTNTRGKERNGRNASNNPLEWLGNSSRARHKVLHHSKTSARIVPKGKIKNNNSINMLAFLKPFLDLPVFAPLERLLLAEASAIHYVSRKNTDEGLLFIERRLRERRLRGTMFIPSQAYEEPTKIARRLKDSRGILFESRRPRRQLT